MLMSMMWPSITMFSKGKGVVMTMAESPALSVPTLNDGLGCWWLYYCNNAGKSVKEGNWEGDRGNPGAYGGLS